MGKSKNETYAERYAAYAMEQMRRYGIPASVTLAQGILESSNGESTLAKKENNHFGIKATQGWLDGGGKYGLYTDDKPNEKFCSYDSVADSYEHHSRFLSENSGTPVVSTCKLMTTKAGRKDWNRRDMPREATTLPRSSVSSSGTGLTGTTAW